MASSARPRRLLRSVVTTVAAGTCLLFGSTALAAGPAPTLTYGAHGATVDQLQADLINLAYHQIPGVNGYFGTGTRSALLSFEKADGLATGATVTPGVWNALRSTLGSCPIGTVTLSEWDSGFAVRVLQGDLWQFGTDPGTVNGIFDPQTTSALRDFQQSNGLTVNGTMDSATFSAILTALGLPASAAPTTGCHFGKTGSNTVTGSTSTGAKSSNSGSKSSGSSSKSSSGSGSSAGTTFVDGARVSGVTQSTATIAGLPVVRVMKIVATAYAPTAQDNYPYGAVDAFGAPLKLGMVAVDPTVIPLHTKMYITGYNSPYLPRGGMLVTALDTGGAIKGDRMDVFIPQTEARVNAFGIQDITVYLLG